MNFTFSTKLYKEGRVSFLAPVQSDSISPTRRLPVFYNPKMELNRDVAIVLIQTYQKTLGTPIDVCEPLAGCGVRGIRFALEVDKVRSVILNDISPKAYELAKKNAELNDLEEVVRVCNMDANSMLSEHSEPSRRFDVIDVDPFGTPTPYLESSIRALKRRSSLLALTATDMPPLCGIYPQVCLRKYGGYSLRTHYCHEIAVRLLIGCTARVAARHELGIKVYFVHSSDHYIRAYLRFSKGVNRANESMKNLGYIFHCFDCENRETINGLIPKIPEACPNCSSVKTGVAGPLWIGMLFDGYFCEKSLYTVEEKMLGTHNRVTRIIRLALNETNMPPTYFNLHVLCDRMNLEIPPFDKVMNRLKENGFEVSRTHFDPISIRTTAGVEEVKSVLRSISKRNKV